MPIEPKAKPAKKSLLEEIAERAQGERWDVDPEKLAAAKEEVLKRSPKKKPRTASSGADVSRNRRRPRAAVTETT